MSVKPIIKFTWEWVGQFKKGGGHTFFELVNEEY